MSRSTSTRKAKQHGGGGASDEQRKVEGTRSVASVRSGRGTALAVVLIVAAGCAAYANSFSSPLIFDAKDFVFQSGLVQQVRPPWELISRTSRPVAVYTFALNYAVHGPVVEGYHAVNLAIHVAAALLLFGIVRRTLGRGRLGRRYGRAAWGLALVIALVWMVHPLQTQSVTYVYQRFESLMGFLFLLMLYAFIRAQDTKHPGWWYGLSAVSCVLAIGTKEVAVTGPVVVALYDRVFLAGAWREVFRVRWKFYAVVGGILAAGAALILASMDLYRGGGVLFVRDVSWLEYAVSQPGVILHYLRLAVWPSGLCLDYGWPVARSAGEIVPPLLAIAGLLGATVWAAFRRPGWGFLGAWFFLILAPTSSIFPIRDPAFEHRMYLPLAAVVVAAAVGGYELLKVAGTLRVPSAGSQSPSRAKGHIATAADGTRSVPAAFLGAVAGAVVVVLGSLTYARNEVYRSEVAVWSDVVAKRPLNARGWDNLGSAHDEIGEKEEAIRCYRRSLELDSNQWLAHYNLGSAVVEIAPEMAAHHLEEALRRLPHHAKAHSNLGVVLARLGKPAEAAEHYEEAIRLAPGDAKAYNNLGTLLGFSEPEKAVASLQKAIALQPGYVDAHVNLGVALAHLGRDAEAAEHYRMALGLKRDHFGAHYNYARLLAEGEPDTAVRHYREALRLNPGFPQAHNGLAGALASLGRIDEAIEQCQLALRIRPDYPLARERLEILLKAAEDGLGGEEPHRANERVGKTEQR